MNKYTVIKKYLQAGNTIRVNAEGNSMFPFYNCEIELLIQAISPRLGYCVLAVSETLGCRVHRIIEIDTNGLYRLKGDSLISHETEVVGEENIIGIVVGFNKNEREYYYKIEKYAYNQVMLIIAKLSKLQNKLAVQLLKRNMKSLKIKILFFSAYNIYLLIIRIFGIIVNKLLVYKIKTRE